ncbi:MAG TPA: 4-hydroxy-tetrahydrodipicolinate reductase, partial [Bacillota bacterium]
MGEKIRVLVSGACGRMGREVVKTVLKDETLQLVGAVDKSNPGKDIGTIIGGETLGIQVGEDLGVTIRAVRPQVMVDFTIPRTVMINLRTALGAGIHVVVGTTGITPENLQ